MPKRELHQRQAFDFLYQRCITQEPFTLSEFQTATGYTNNISFNTYRSKHFKTLLRPCVDNKFRVSFAFRKFTWPRFRDEIVSQNRRLTRTYQRICRSHVLLFEFFMPLRNEEWLRSALDSLFFKDTVVPRLKVITIAELAQHFPRSAQTEEQYLDGVCQWISDVFGGYSISHVSGRFKVGNIKNRKEIAEAESIGNNRYLVDETTAIVRFIFPCKGADLDAAENEATQIRWFFEKLFVETILEVVNGEDEIWLLESGMRHQLHIFRAED